MKTRVIEPVFDGGATVVSTREIPRVLMYSEPTDAPKRSRDHRYDEQKARVLSLERIPLDGIFLPHGPILHRRQSMYELIRIIKIIRIIRIIAFISEPPLKHSTQPSLATVTPRRILSRPDDQQALLELFVAEKICSAARPAVSSSGGKAVQGGG